MRSLRLPLPTSERAAAPRAGPAALCPAGHRARSVDAHARAGRAAASRREGAITKSGLFCARCLSWVSDSRVHLCASRAPGHQTGHVQAWHFTFRGGMARRAGYAAPLPWRTEEPSAPASRRLGSAYTTFAVLVLFDSDGALPMDDDYAHGRAIVVAAGRVYQAEIRDDAGMHSGRVERLIGGAPGPCLRRGGPSRWMPAEHRLRARRGRRYVLQARLVTA
jgi:hypothetical protein